MSDQHPRSGFCRYGHGAGHYSGKLPHLSAGQSLKIYFSFVVVSLGCACYGPLVGMGVGAVIDTLGFLLSSYGEPYFPGYIIRPCCPA